MLKMSFLVRISHFVFGVYYLSDFDGFRVVVLCPKSLGISVIVMEVDYCHANKPLTLELHSAF